MGTRLNIQAVVGIGIPLAVLGRVLTDRRRLEVNRVLLLAAGYAAVLGVGVLISPSRGGAVADFCRIALPLVFVIGGQVIGARGASPVGIAAFLAAYALVPVTAALVELLGLLPASIEGVANAGTVLRLRGLYQHPLDIAMRCSMAAPFALMIWRTTTSRSEKWMSVFWGICTTAMAAGTLVRSAVIATVAQLMTWLWLSRLRRYAAMVPIVGLILGLGWGPLRKVAVNAIEPIQTGAVYRFGSGRTLILLAQIAGFQKATPLQKLVGRGLHTSAAVSLEYSPAPDINPQALDFEEGKITAHNQVMRVLTENGLVGLGIFTTLIFATWRRLLGSVSRVNDSHQQAFITATLASLAAACVYAISATPFDVPAVSWPIWLTIGISNGFCEMNAGRSGRNRSTITEGRS